MNITINRKSVCSGDDINDHRITYTINTTTKFSDVFKDLIKQGYFPKVEGNDVVWTLFLGSEDFITWITKSDEFISRFIHDEPPILSMRDEIPCEINFEYYSSPTKRAYEIFKKFDGLKFHIWHDGYMGEYKNYGIPIMLEESWRKQLDTRKYQQ